jgi:predicted nucleic acid-binding protein
MSYLCDTNIISELARPKPNIGVVAWSASVKTITLSAITLEEIAFGLTSKPNPRIQTWFQNFLSTYCQVLPITPEIAQLAGEIRGGFRIQGIARSQADILIAATTKVHNLTLVTRNIRDFENCGISLLNPFDMS